MAGVGSRGLIPNIAKSTGGAKRAKVEAASYAEKQLKIGLRERQDRAAVVWGKAAENVRKLALIYAISEDWMNPEITSESVHFARDIIFNCCHKMISSATAHIVDSDDDRQIATMRELVKNAGVEGISQRDLSRRSHVKKKTLQEILVTLADQEYILCRESENKRGRPSLRYFYCDD